MVWPRVAGNLSASREARHCPPFTSVKHPERSLTLLRLLSRVTFFTHRLGLHRPHANVMAQSAKDGVYHSPFGPVERDWYTDILSLSWKSVHLMKFCELNFTLIDLGSKAVK